MEKKMMKSNGVDSRSSAMKRRRLFSTAAVLLAVCLVFVGAAGADAVAKIDGKGEFNSIQDAINSVDAGGTAIITVIKNHCLDIEEIHPVKAMDLNNNPNKERSVFVSVKDNKVITINLNGKKVTADYSDGTTDIYSVIGVVNGAKLTLIDNPADKTEVGGLYVVGNKMVRHVLGNYNHEDNDNGEEGYSLVIKGGSYVMEGGKGEQSQPSSIIYARNDRTTWVKSGTFTMSNTGEDTGNGSPWIFNTEHGESNQIVVTGGTFNADVNHQHYEYEVYIPESLAVSETIDAKGESWWTVVPAVAYVTEYQTRHNWFDDHPDDIGGSEYERNVGYATVEDAVSNVGKHHAPSRTDDFEQYTITLIKDVDVTETLKFGTSESPLAKSTVFDMSNHKLIWKGGADDKLLTVSGDGNTLTINSFNIIREGYTITMWNLDSQQYATLPVIANGQVVVQTSLSIAEPEPNTYTVIFDKNGAESGTMANQEFTYDVAQPLTPNAFIKTGYSFDSWNTKADGSGIPYKNKATVENLTSVNGGTFTLYANWTAEYYTVTVTSTEGGTASASSSSAKYGEEITLTALPDEGYSFIGWVTESNIEISPDGKFTMPADDVTVKAVFKENSAEEEIITPPSGGGGGDGGALSFPRTTENGGLVDFGSSKVVKALMLPEGSSGSVLLKVDTIEKWPKAVETEYTFDISVEKLGDGMAYILFEIPVSTLERLGITPADIGAYHLVDDVWVKLAATYEVKDGTVFYEAATDSFSPFKLVIEEGAATQKAEETEPTVPPTEEPDVPDEPELLPPIDEPVDEPETPKTPAPILAVLAGLGAAAVLRRK